MTAHDVILSKAKDLYEDKMMKNNISEQEIRKVFDKAAALLPGTKYVVCKLENDIDYAGY